MVNCDWLDLDAALKMVLNDTVAVHLSKSYSVLLMQIGILK